MVALNLEVDLEICPPILISSWQAVYFVTDPDGRVDTRYKKGSHDRGSSVAE
jgi:hypothetical protein